jgi:hypothetical protein
VVEYLGLSLFSAPSSLQADPLGLIKCSLGREINKVTFFHLIFYLCRKKKSAGGTIKAGSGDDEILASGEAIYTIYGDRGDDRIIVGTDLSNTAFGGSGDDYLEATFGDNTLYGDKGEDTFVSSGSETTTYIGGEGEVPHEAKTGGGPILLTCSFPYVRDWLNNHPFRNSAEARLICNLHNGSPIKPEANT